MYCTPPYVKSWTRKLESWTSTKSSTMISELLLIFWLFKKKLRLRFLLMTFMCSWLLPNAIVLSSTWEKWPYFYHAWNLKAGSMFHFFSRSGSSWSGTVIGNSACLSACLSDCLSVYGSSSAHRQDGPHVYYTKMTGYLDIHETFFSSDL